MMLKSTVPGPKSKATENHLRAGITAALLLTLMLCGCVSRKPFVGSRPFDFQTDTFAYSNSLVWDYYFDEQGNWVHKRHEPVSDYTHHCFVVARSARQFFQSARFDPARPIADAETYRHLIREVVAIDPARVVPAEKKIVIPGYANLREFSQAQEKLLKAECGGAWESYFQRGHWRMIMPFSRNGQAAQAERLLADLKDNRPPVVHIVRFPQLSINHSVLVFDAEQTESSIEFSVYDPYRPDAPQVLHFDRTTRTFSFAANDYWPGGKLNAYEVYCGWFY